MLGKLYRFPLSSIAEEGMSMNGRVREREREREREKGCE